MKKVKFRDLAKKEIYSEKRDITKWSDIHKMTSEENEVINVENKIKIPKFFKKIYPELSEDDYRKFLEDEFFLEKEVLICPECYCDIVEVPSESIDERFPETKIQHEKEKRNKKDEIHKGFCIKIL